MIPRTRPVQGGPHPGRPVFPCSAVRRRTTAIAVAAAAVLALLAAPGGARAQGIGAFFTQVNTYVYLDGPEQGGRYLLRPRQAFTVLDVTLDGKERPWYRIVYPARTHTVTGTGWTPRAPHELLPSQREPVLVFSRVLDGSGKPFEVRMVEVAQLELLDESQPSEVYGRVTWHKVRYTLEEPVQAWARGTAGLYRPAKTSTFLSLVYGEMVTRDLPHDTVARLLSGVVRAGDSTRQVRWALGPPVRTQEEVIGETMRVTWEYPHVVVHFENAVVKQIN